MEQAGSPRRGIRDRPSDPGSPGSPPARERPHQRRLRADLVAFVGVLVLPGLSVVAWRLPRQATAELEQTLVLEAEALARERPVRRPHRLPALAGSFGERFAPQVPGLLDADAILGRYPPEVIEDVALGSRSLDELPDGLPAALLVADAALDGALTATWAETPEPPEALRPFVGGHDPSEADPFLRAYETAGLLGALRVQQQLARGDATGALESCIDVLALARDAGWSTGMQGLRRGLFIAARAIPGCARALDHASVEEKRSAIELIGLIRDGHRPHLSALQQDSVELEVRLFGPLLAGARLAELPERARRAAGRGQAVSPLRGLGGRLLLRDAWADLHSVHGEVLAAAALAPAERGARLKAASDRMTHWLNPLSLIVAVDHAGDEQRLQRADRALAALVALAGADVERAETGEFPDRLDDFGTAFAVKHGSASLLLELERRGAGARPIVHVVLLELTPEQPPAPESSTE